MIQIILALLPKAKGWLSRNYIYLLGVVAVIGVAVACHWLYQQGQKAERNDWLVNTAAAEKEENQATISNQKVAHEIRTTNANRASGDAWRMLVQNWSR